MSRGEHSYARHQPRLEALQMVREALKGFLPGAHRCCGLSLKLVGNVLRLHCPTLVAVPSHNAPRVPRLQTTHEGLSQQQAGLHQNGNQACTLCPRRHARRRRANAAACKQRRPPPPHCRLRAAWRPSGLVGPTAARHCVGGSIRPGPSGRDRACICSSAHSRIMLGF